MYRRPLESFIYVEGLLCVQNLLEVFLTQTIYLPSEGIQCTQKYLAVFCMQRSLSLICLKTFGGLQCIEDLIFGSLFCQKDLSDDFSIYINYLKFLSTGDLLQAISVQKTVHYLRPVKTSVDPFGVGAHNKLRAFGFTGAVKQGAPGARLSHMPCHNFMPFSKRQFWKSDSFK